MPDEQSVEEKVVDPMTLFSPKMRQPVEGLAYLGQLTEDVKFCGHTFGIRTLRPQHRYAISTVLQPYRNTIYEIEVYQALHVAAALTHVDNKRDFCEPIGPDIEGFLRGRLEYLTNDKTGWYPPTLEFLYARCAVLEATATQGVDQLNFLSQKNESGISSSPWQEALTERESSEEAMNSVIQRFMGSN
jgi:hypothetical protein